MVVLRAVKSLQRLCLVAVCSLGLESFVSFLGGAELNQILSVSNDLLKLRCLPVLDL